MPSQGGASAKKNQCRDVQTALNEQFRIAHQLLFAPLLDAWIRGFARPTFPKICERDRREIVERGSTRLRRVVRASFGKHSAQVGFWNRHKLITRAPEVSSVVLPCRAGQAGWNVDDENARGMIVVFLNGDSMMQAFVETGLCPARFSKRRRADDITGTPIGHTQDNLSAAFVRQGDAVIYQLLKMKAASRGLELKTNSLGFRQPTFKLFERCHARYSVNPAASAARVAGGCFSKPFWST